jgi:hypothetical protein
MAALTGAIARADGRVQHWRLIMLGTRAEGLAMRPTMSAELSRRVMDAAEEIFRADGVRPAPGRSSLLQIRPREGGTAEEYR